LRADYFGFVTRAFYPAVRLSLDYRPIAGVKIKSSLGRYFQSPSYVWTINRYNRDLQALKNDMLILGADYRLRDDANLSIESYYKRYGDLPTGAAAGKTDYLVLTNTGVGFGGREDDYQSFGYIDLVSEGTGKAYGLEVLLQKKYSDLPLYGQLGITYGKSQYTAGNGVTYPGQFDQRIIVNLSAGYKFNSKWEMSGKFRYFTGAPYTPVYLPQDNDGFVETLPEEYLSARLSPAHHLDLRVDRRFNFSKWTMIVFVDVQNIYNYALPIRPRYDFWEESIETRNSIGVLPTLGISAEF
jgi:hypothetical protein